MPTITGEDATLCLRRLFPDCSNETGTNRSTRYRGRRHSIGRRTGSFGWFGSVGNATSTGTMIEDLIVRGSRRLRCGWRRNQPTRDRATWGFPSGCSPDFAVCHAGMFAEDQRSGSNHLKPSWRADTRKCAVRPPGAVSSAPGWYIRSRDHSCHRGGDELVGAIDIDQYDDFDLVALEAQLDLLSLPLVPVRSKSGGWHLYLLCREAVSAELVRETLKEWAKTLGYPKAEVFPKQTTLSSLGRWETASICPTSAGIRVTGMRSDQAKHSL